MSATLKRLQILRRQRKLDDDSYRALLVRITGQDSSRGLSDPQLRRVIDAIVGGDGRRSAEGEVPAKIRALVWDLYHLGEWSDHPTERAIGAFVLRQTGVDDLRWLTPERVSSVVEALRAMLARAGLKLPSGVRPDKAELMLISAQARCLSALDAPGDVVAQLAAVAENGCLDEASRRRLIADAGARIRTLRAARAAGGPA